MAVLLGSAEGTDPQAEAQMLPVQVSKSTLADWKDSAATFVR
jgi:hypothetical protein